MIPAPARSFAGVFTEAYRAKTSPATKTIAPRRVQSSSNKSGELLASFGNSRNFFTFTDEGVSFKDRSGNTGRYSWDELDFILPYDLSMATDKLYVFTDLSRYTYAIAFAIGLVIAFAALAALIGFAVFLIVSICSAIVGWIASLPVLVLIILGALFIFFGIPALIAISLSLIASITLITAGITFLLTGGFVYTVARGLAKKLQPLVEQAIPARIKQFHNGLFLIKGKWIKPPVGTQTTEVLDFIMIGIKLRRAGLR